MPLFQQLILTLLYNGKISNFNDIKKDIVKSIDKEIFSKIKGNTDSEYCFGVYLSLLKRFDPIQAFKNLVKIIYIFNQIFKYYSHKW